jgi:hypothetical protein
MALSHHVPHQTRWVRWECGTANFHNGWPSPIWLTSGMVPVAGAGRLQDSGIVSTVPMRESASDAHSARRKSERVPAGTLHAIAPGVPAGTLTAPGRVTGTDGAIRKTLPMPGQLHDVHMQAQFEAAFSDERAESIGAVFVMAVGGQFQVGQQTTSRMSPTISCGCAICSCPAGGCRQVQGTFIESEFPASMAHNNSSASAAAQEHKPRRRRRPFNLPGFVPIFEKLLSAQLWKCVILSGH